jgi:hypothetical protein
MTPHDIFLHMHMERAGDRLQEQDWRIGSSSVVRTFLGVSSVFSIERSRALQAGACSAGRATARGKR